MRKFVLNIFVFGLFLFGNILFAQHSAFGMLQQKDTTKNQIKRRAVVTQSPFYKDVSTAKDTTLRFPFDDNRNNVEYGSQSKSPLYLANPDNIKTIVTYDPITKHYIIQQTIGGMNYRNPIEMTAEEYRRYIAKQSLGKYWVERNRTENALANKGVLSRINFKKGFLDKFFGGDEIDIIPQGSAELRFGAKITTVENPTLPEDLRQNTSFDFDEKIQMNVTGTVGTKLKMSVNYNTEATFDFENQMRLDYTGEEDDIIKKIEAGNVSMPISNSLITGGQNLFGLKTQLQFGKLMITSVFSQQKGETSVVQMENGAQKQEYELSVEKYEANRHFFLSKYFYDNYDKALAHLPVVKSGVTITKIEVWITNKSSNFKNARNLVALTDLGESAANISNSMFSQTGGGTLPDNSLNNEYEMMNTTYGAIREIKNVTGTFAPLAPRFVSGTDYEKVENARLLSETEYQVNKKLGYISLNQSLKADEVLAVAYEYIYNGEVKTVGELTSNAQSAPSTLILKLIKGTNLSPKMPTWNLMMKNIYNIGAYQINSSDFVLNVMYQNKETGTNVNYISEGAIKDKILLKVLNLDNLNSQLDPGSDGMFDFIEGITIQSNGGRVIFPAVEPFGKYLRKKIGNNAIADKYVYEELYTLTQNEAQQIAHKNRFTLKGSYKSSNSSEISLNGLNVQPGSVVVQAGGRTLVENIDYTVDYMMGKVKIINQSLLESSTPIQIKSENNSTFNLQTKTLMGVQLDYKVNDNLNLGATVMHLSERPLTQKVNIGKEPISNTIWGFNGSFQTESMFLTRMVDKLPLISTKEPSRIEIEGEFAQLVPGHNSAVGASGTAYIDDFEGTETSIDMKTPRAWVLASTPQNNKLLFPEGNLSNNLEYGYNRAKLAWYTIDPLFLRNTSATPAHIKGNKELLSNHFVREIYEEEIWPNKERAAGIPSNIPILNLAYYPNEKGPYNFDVDGKSGISKGMNADGTLKDPESRWGGIMRSIETNDFQAANIAYIEFWVMDPFVYNENHQGGDLYFNLGNVSEDILRDSRKSFENGLPTTEVVTLVDTTTWGRVPIVQSLVNAFDNNNTARKYQDIGFDGLNNEDELTFFNEYIKAIEISPNLGTSSQAYVMAKADPSGDDYHYFRGSDYDAQKLGILERYKAYNGVEGNSPTTDMSKESYPTSYTSLPDVEDINRDNTLSETEAYYQYRIHLSPNDMQIGKNFITDKITSSVKLKNGTQSEISWYQFKIPINQFDDRFGNIDGFTSIRFMRMFLKGFKEKVILRFASLDLVRDDWREFSEAINEDPNDTTESTAKFDITAVNIEENAKKTPVNYILPPAIDRVVDPNNPQVVQLNEQSLLLKVNDLEDAKGKAAYKTISMDIRKYGKLIMDVHAEEIEGRILHDNEMVAFIRIGSDYQDNYYEYEIPLKLTPPGNYNGNRKQDRRIVWPDENRFNVRLKLFQTIKQLRNDAKRAAGSNINYTSIFERKVGEISRKAMPYEQEQVVRIKGNPSLANIRTIMVGIKNPSEDITGSDDHTPKSVEVWMNELRLSDFEEEGGWAANLRVTTRLADLGTVTWAGSRVTRGFGGIEAGVHEREKNDMFQYDLSTSLELGKFFPEKSGVKIPMYYAISERTVSPEYNPLDPDIPLDIALDNAPNKSVRDSIKRISQDYTKRKSFNLTNVHIEKKEGKPKLLDVSNLSLTYSYNETYSRNVNTVRDLEKNYRGVVSYNYTGRPKLVQPLKRVRLFQKPMFRLLRDFNFYYMPTQLSFRSDIQRYYHEIENRNIEAPGVKITPSYDKDFLWYRYYDLKYNLTKNLKFDFSATNTSRIDEPDGIVDKDRDRDAYNIWKDSIWNNLMDGGRNIQYHHNFNVSYKVPIDKIPLLNWLSVNARYTGSYDWSAGPITEESVELGNTVRNSNNIQLSNQLRLVNLYNKIGILKKINRKFNSQRKYSRRGKNYTTANYEESIGKMRRNIPVVVYHKLGTKDITVKAFNSKGKRIRVKIKPVGKNKAKVIASRRLTDVKIKITGRITEKEDLWTQIGERALRVLMSVRNIGINYSEINASNLSGYLPSSNFFGGTTYRGSKAPGFGFLIGNQDKSFARRAAQNGWLTTDPTLNEPYTMSHTQNVSMRATIEPVKGFRIDLNANRTYTKNRSEYYIFNPNSGVFENKNLTNTGNFTMSFFSLKSAFFKIGNPDNYSSKYFNDFLENRKKESERLARKRYGENYKDIANVLVDKKGNPTGFYKGYGETSQEVLIPAFLKAYGAGGGKLNKLFPGIAAMRPNWRINFDGLSKMPFIRRHFKSVNVSHAYTSTYNVGSYNTNMKYQIGDDGLALINEITNNVYTLYDANSVSINEQFNPLINVNMIWKNNLSTSFEIKRTRNLMLGLTNSQLTEVASNEMVLGIGYRFDNFGMIIGGGAKQKKFNSDLNLRANLSIRKNSTIIRKIADGVDQLTSGQKVVSIKLSADYVLSNRFNLRLFYDRIVNKPYVSLAYPTTTTEFGASLRFTLNN